MYCQKCGIHNTDDAKQCQICGIEITGEEKQEHTRIFTDLTKFPFRAILSISLKTMSPPLIFIMLPMIAIFYFLRKMIGKPFLSLYLNSKTPKFHKTEIDQFQRLHRRSFEKVSSYLVRHGFEPFIDLEDVSMIQGNLQRIFINRRHKIYSTIHINKAKGKVIYVMFSAVTPNKTYLLIDNAYSIPLQYPENLIVKHFPEQSVRRVYREFLHLLDKLQEEPQALELEYYLPIGYNIRKFWIEQGLQQNILYVKAKGTSDRVTCYHHPTNVAVRTCSVCNTSLCEACYTLYQDQYYCHNCLPEEARTTASHVVTKHPRRKAVLSWCILCVLLGIIMGTAGLYWNKSIIMPSWFLSLFGRLSPYDFATEITLGSEWIRQFDNENPLIFPYVIRGEQYILSTTNSLEALDMRTGDLLWKKDNFHNATIQTRSKDPQIPLIIIQYQENGTSALLNVEPESGAIIWEQVLESSKSFITIDAQTILVYDNTRIREYNREGTLLWEKRFQDSFMNEYAILNKHVLLGRYSGSKTAQTLMYLERQTGEVLWKIEKSPYHLGHVLGEGYQVFYTDEGKTVLMYLPEQKLLWELSQDIGHVMAYDETQSYLYTTTSTVRVKDGANVFSYPSNAHFTGQVTDDFLIVLRTNHKSEMFLIDKVTGDVTTSFQEKTWSVVVYLTEDESQLYLAAQNRPTDPKNIEVLSELLIIDKKTFELREVPVGKNIGALQFKVFPGENLVFIPTYHQVGGYRIED
jgi:hypothetical protein